MSGLCGRDVQLAAIDMPLAYTPICGRRTSDNDLSRAISSTSLCKVASPRMRSVSVFPSQREIDKRYYESPYYIVPDDKRSIIPR